MKEFILVMGMIVCMGLMRITFDFQATPYSVAWQTFAVLFALAYQSKSYEKSGDNA